MAQSGLHGFGLPGGIARRLPAAERDEALRAWLGEEPHVSMALLQRLAQKGYVTHQVEGRTYLYRASEPRKNVAAQAAKLIIDRFCGGSLEELLVGLVDNDVVSRKELQQLARRIASKKPGVK